MGGITRWFYEGLAGIKATSPGYKNFDINPHFMGNINTIQASIDTHYGLISFATEKEDNTVRYEVVVPCGTSATLHLENGEVLHLQSGKHSIRI